MDRLERGREQLLFAILRLVDDGTLAAGRFRAVEIRTFGGVALLLARHAGGGDQPNIEGYLMSDLRALARAGYLDLDVDGKGADVTVLRQAYSYREEWQDAAMAEAPGVPSATTTDEHTRSPLGMTQGHREAGAGAGREYDAFICHAHADKMKVARPLVQELMRLGYRVWYDEWSLSVGDSLRERIDEGLRRSRYGVVILSPAFFSRAWPQKELDGLAAREANGTKVILPVWHEIGADGVAERSPLLAARMAALTTDGIPAVAQELSRVLTPNALETEPPHLTATAPPPADFADAPILRWLDPSVQLIDLAPALDVWCENSGHPNSTAVVLRRWAEMNRPDESARWEPLEFEGFNVPSYIHSIHGGDPQRRFLVQMRAQRHARELGPVLIRWSVLYLDNAMANGYVTTASVVAHLDGPDPTRLTDLALDTTSARTRYERYLSWVREHGSPST